MRTLTSEELGKLAHVLEQGGVKARMQPLYLEHWPTLSFDWPAVLAALLGTPPVDVQRHWPWASGMHRDLVEVAESIVGGTFFGSRDRCAVCGSGDAVRERTNLRTWLGDAEVSGSSCDLVRYWVCSRCYTSCSLVCDSKDLSAEAVILCARALLPGSPRAVPKQEQVPPSSGPAPVCRCGAPMKYFGRIADFQHWRCDRCGKGESAERIPAAVAPVLVGCSVRGCQEEAVGGLMDGRPMCLEHKEGFEGWLGLEGKRSARKLEEAKRRRARRLGLERGPDPRLLGLPLDDNPFDPRW